MWKPRKDVTAPGDMKGLGWRGLEATRMACFSQGWVGSAVCQGPWPQGTDEETWGRHTLSDNSLVSSEDRTERCGINRHF